jgi:HAD superfamily hydrolase (TIGR01509 family)
MKFKAVIFDMDGVLVDTERYYLQRREDFFGTRGVSIAHLSPSDFIGGNMKDIWPRILLDNYDQATARALQADYDDYKKDKPLPYAELLFPDVREILDFLRAENVKIGLASSSAMHDIDLMLDTHDLRGCFDVISSGNDLKQSKPHPEIYQKALTGLSVSPDEALIIEDSENGIKSGKAAKATVWAIKDYRFGMNQTQADHFVENLTDIKNQLTEK